MLRLDPERGLIVGPHGSLRVPADGGASVKLAMLIAGECLGLGPDDAADAFDYSRQRYFQLRHAFDGGGAAALADRKPGPAPAAPSLTEAIRQIVRHRFLDPEASPEVIAQRLAQSGQATSVRSVQRVLAWFGLGKKNSMSAGRARCRRCWPSPGGDTRARSSATRRASNAG